MLTNSDPTISKASSPGKLADYSAFIKFRLAMLVVFSAVIGFIIASPGPVDWVKAGWLTLAGFLVTGCANGFNEILEKDLDKLMDRTANRPLPQGRMTVEEGVILASCMGALGLFILFFFLNPLSCILSAVSTALYVLVYTPLKQKTAFAVFVGAFPGALPPLLGCVAATEGFGTISFQAWVLFIIQFIWQFPHFWAIAWVMDDDYKKAGFRLLPSRSGRGKQSAFQIMVYTLFLIPISLMPVLFHMTQTALAPITILACGIVFLVQAIKLYNDCTIKSAQQVMFGSFAYLPVVQLAILLG